jgi:hypothetical protein
MKCLSYCHPGQAAKRREPGPMRSIGDTVTRHGSRLSLRSAGMTVSVYCGSSS